jgi:DNA repair protein RadA/Sms
MSKKMTLFECQHCGLTTPRWMGKCTNCGAWDSFVELNEHHQEIAKQTQATPAPSTKAQCIN